jgi:NTP pyrophosphatase (non-canonical NTP hydrolase)
LSKYLRLATTVNEVVLNTKQNTMINELAKQIHKNAIDKGFFEKEKNIGEMLCLIHSEVSEALEADRNDKHCAVSILGVNGWVDNDYFKVAFKNHVKGTFEEEMADIIIRVLDLCAFLEIDIEQFIKCKTRFNSLREKYHGKKY